MPAFSPFPTMFSKALCFRVIESQDCVVESEGHAGLYSTRLQVYMRNYYNDIFSTGPMKHSVYMLFYHCCLPLRVRLEKMADTPYRQSPIGTISPYQRDLTHCGII